MCKLMIYNVTRGMLSAGWGVAWRRSRASVGLRQWQACEDSMYLLLLRLRMLVCP